jgi:putative nucleotidyltransferase with HDIG domain
MGAAIKDSSALAGIPAFPPIALRLMRLISSEDVALSEVIELLRADAAFSAELLRRANSPLFDVRRQINSLQHALVVLGLRRVRSLTMTVASGIFLRRALRVEELRCCWRHTLASALLTEQLARICSIHEDVAYTAGLLHDIGRLGLLTAHPQEYAEMLRSAAGRAPEDQEFDLLDYEKDTFGMDHCEAGNLLVKEWALPEEFLIITGRHHDPPSGLGIDLLGLVYLGCQLADSLGFYVIPPCRPWPLEEIRDALPEAARRRLRSGPEELKEFVEARIQAMDVTVEDPADTEAPHGEVPAPAESEATPPTEPAVAPKPAVAPEPPPRDTLVRDVLTAVACALTGAGAFFLVMRLLAE